MCSHISSSNSTHKMIPLFYKVEPSHVRYPRNEKGPYAKAFHDHSTKGRYTTETIEQWKKALKQAYDLSGFSLEDASGYEGKLVKLVLTEILNTLDIGSLDVANNHPVGLTERIDKVKNLLRANQNDKRVSTLGIWGMGGIGKTTLSKAVFNDMKSIFDGSCFVSDVRERTLKEGLTKLQEQILNELLHLELKVNSVDAGKMKMRERLRSKRVLLILDDVDDRKQLEALHVDRCFGGGSRVIITNPDKHILNLGQADEIYEAEELEHHQALQLFCWHAFLRENSNLRGFKWSHFENVVPMESLALMKNLAFLWLENGLSGLQVLCPSPNRILEIELQLRMQRMLKPTKGIRLGEYCVLEDAKCTGIVVCLVSVAGIEVVNISTEDNKILTHITLPYFNCYEDEHHVRIIQEELPSIIKFRSGDIIRCSTSHGTQIVGVYLVLDQNESGNDEGDIQSNQSLHMDDRPLNAHD
eukprot:Gb_16251 [translate_table: standard]